MLAFIAKGIEYKGREVATIQGFGEAAPGVLCTILVPLFEERCSGIGGSSEEVH